MSHETLRKKGQSKWINQYESVSKGIKKGPALNDVCAGASKPFFRGKRLFPLKHTGAR